MELPSSYLTNRTTVDLAIAEYTVDGVPFGHANDDWQRLLVKMRDGDELWNFAPPDSHSLRLSGVALVRDGVVISTVIVAVD